LLTLAESGCSPDASSVIYGEWGLSQIYCNGAEVSLVAGAAVNLTFTHPESSSTSITDPDGDGGGGVCSLSFDGGFAQSGLQLQEIPTALTCAGDCTVSPLTSQATGSESCTSGTSEVSNLDAEYNVHFPDRNTMQLSFRDPNFLCAEGSEEILVYTRN
jgi:hypothetical protein